MREVTFLRHRTSGKVIAPDLGKVRAIAGMKLPTNNTTRSILGMVNYLSKLIGSLAEIERSLRELPENTRGYGKENNRKCL